MFKFNPFRCRFSRPRQVTTLVEQKVNKDGVIFSTFVDSPVDGSTLPSFKDYQLDKLIAAGVPLSPVSPVYNEVPDEETLSRLDSSLTPKDSDSDSDSDSE